MKPKYRIKVITDTGESYKITLRRKRAIWSIYKHDNFSEWELEVIYKKGVTNSGVFKSRKEMLQVFKTWTEKPLLDYLKDF